MPTAVYFPRTGKAVIGEDALKKLAEDPLNVVYDVKRIVGRKCEDAHIAEFARKHEFALRCTEAQGLMLHVPNLGEGENAWIRAEQALAVVLAQLVEAASGELQVPYLRDVVVSIPALFHNGQRKAIRSACALAGLRVRQLVVEPTAAALAYSYYSSTPSDNFKLFLTLDMGGGTIDCSVLRCTGVDCQALDVRGNSSLGGIGIDFEAVVRKFEEQHGWSADAFSPQVRAKFEKHIPTCRCLSTRRSARPRRRFTRSASRPATSG